MKMGTIGRRLRGSRATVDVVLIVGIAVVIVVLISLFDVFERFMEWSKGHEGWEIDKILLMIALLSVALAVFSWRRWRETLREMTQRRHYAGQLEALQEVGLEITSQLDLESLLYAIVSQSMRLLGDTTGGLYLYRPDEDVIERVVSAGPQAPPVGLVLHRGEGLSGKVWETGESLIVDNYSRWEGQANLPELRARAYGAALGVPIKGEEFLGVLAVSTPPGSTRTFTRADAELLSLFATQAAIAIHNAGLYEAETLRAEAFERANEELQRMQEALVKAERMSAMHQVVVTVCHEINNPLTAVLGYAQWLLSRGDVRSPKIREALELIEEAAVRIRDVVRKLDRLEDRPVPYMSGTMMIDLHNEGETGDESSQ